MSSGRIKLEDRQTVDKRSYFSLFLYFFTSLPSLAFFYIECEMWCNYENHQNVYEWMNEKWSTIYRLHLFFLACFCCDVARSICFHFITICQECEWVPPFTTPASSQSLVKWKPCVKLCAGGIITIRKALTLSLRHTHSSCLLPLILWMAKWKWYDETFFFAYLESL